MKVLKSNASAQSPKRAAAPGGYKLLAFPKEFERGLFDGIDTRYYIILLSSIAAVFTLVLVLANTEYSEEALRESLKQKYMQKYYAVEFDEPPPTEAEPEALGVEEGANQQQQQADQRAERDEGKRGEASGTSAAERREQAMRAAARRAAQRSGMEQAVAGTGILGELSAGGGGGSGDAVYDVLGESGSGSMGNLDQVLAGAGGLQSASSNARRSVLGERGGGGGRTSGAGIDDLIGTGVGQSGSVSISRKAGFSIKAVGGSVSGKGSKSTARTQEAIGRVVSQHADAIENCYKREARINPDLKGSISIQFTIDPGGRVTNVRVLESSIKNRNVENCVVRRVRSWRFEQIDRSEGDVSARYKWIFSS